MAKLHTMKQEKLKSNYVLKTHKLTHKFSMHKMQPQILPRQTQLPIQLLLRLQQLQQFHPFLQLQRIKQQLQQEEHLLQQISCSKGGRLEDKRFHRFLQLQLKRL
jgi:hypothetical protein